MKLAWTEARKAGITRLDRIIVNVGDLSGVSIDSVEFAFSFLREEDDLTKQTELVVQRTRGKGRCKDCGKEVELEHLFLYCPECKTPTIEITQGRDFMLISLEGENEIEETAEPGARPDNARP